jgi:hypothetical protein
MNLPKYYSNVCEEMPPEYSDYENYEVKFGYFFIQDLHLAYIEARITLRLLRK